MEKIFRFEETCNFNDFALKHVAVYDFSNISTFSCANNCDTIVAIIRKEQEKRLLKEAKKYNGITYYIISEANHKNGSDFELLSVIEKMNRLSPEKVSIVSNDKGFDDYVNMQKRLGNHKFSRIGTDALKKQTKRAKNAKLRMISAFISKKNEENIRVGKSTLKQYMDEKNITDNMLRGDAYKLLKNQI